VIFILIYIPSLRVLCLSNNDAYFSVYSSGLDVDINTGYINQHHSIAELSYIEYLAFETLEQQYSMTKVLF